MLETATEGGERRERLKSLNLWQKKRRLRALEDVKKLRSEAREAELALRRRSGSQGVNTTTESVDTSSSSSSGGGAGAGGDFRDDSRPGFIRAKETRKRYASQLSVLEWLIDVPEDLHTSWYVMPRPEGPRCLVISENGSTVSRTKNGSFHKEFQSTLPNGSRESSRASCKGSKCVLDAVFHSPSNTFFVTDCMVWEDYSLTNCDFEFRRFWVSQKLSESGGQQVQPHQASKFKVEIIPMEVATQQMLVNAYSNEFPYTKDGLILIHKDCLYAEGQTPLCLQWKDESCSRYPIDTDANGNVLEKQSVVLQLGEDQRTLCTGDCPPIALGALPQDFVEQNSGLLNSGTLFRCNIGARGFDFAPDGRPVGAHLELVGVSRKRVAGEIVSRILFQYLTRTRQITFQSLLGGGMNG